MATATLTSKGQITLPKVVRETLRLKVGDRLDFRIEDDGTVVLRPLARPVADAFGAFAYKATAPRSTAEIDEALAAAFRNGTI